MQQIFSPYPLCNRHHSAPSGDSLVKKKKVVKSFPWLWFHPEKEEQKVAKSVWIT